jgi:hypothetical protein
MTGGSIVLIGNAADKTIFVIAKPSPSPNISF